MLRLWDSLRTAFIVFFTSVLFISTLARANVDLPSTTPWRNDDEIAVFSLANKTTAIVIGWNFTAADSEGTRFVVQIWKQDGGDVYKTSERLKTSERSYEITGLEANSKYRVCVQAFQEDSSAEDYRLAGETPPRYVNCDHVATIPYVRLDAVIAVTCVIGYIILMVLIGVICWRCATKTRQAEEVLLNKEDELEGSAGKAESCEPLLVETPSAEKRYKTNYENEINDFPFIDVSTSMERINEESGRGFGRHYPYS